MTEEPARPQEAAAGEWPAAWHLSDRLLRVLHALPFGVMVADAAGRWDMVNAAAARLAAQDLETLDCWEVPLLDAAGMAAGHVRVIADAGDRRVLERALADSEERYRALFDSAYVPFVLLGADGELLQYNEAWARMLGYEPAELGAGASLFRGLEAGLPQGDGGTASGSGGGGTAEGGGGIDPMASREQAYVCKDGSLRWGETRIVSPIRNDRDAVVAHLAVVQDVTERHTLEDSLRHAIAEADFANRAKSSFLAAMSHEIRTPLNGIMGMLELALRAGLPADTAEILSIAYGSARSLLGILNDILDFSKIEAGHMALEKVPVSPADVIEDVAEALAGTAISKGLRLAVEVDPAAPAWVAGDPLRLRQVLTNLVGNALKFTERGGVTLRLETATVEDGHAILDFAVADTGIGIPAEAVGGLFKPFSQAEDSTTRRFGGTGLGLSISQRLVALMGGEIEVDSTPGAGSTFSFTLRCRLAEAPADAAVAPLPVLHGVACAVVLADVAEGRQVRRLLAAAGAAVEAGDRPGDRPGSGPASVLVTDAGTAEGPVVRLVDVGEDGRSGGMVPVVVRPLRRRALLRAVAAAAGRHGGDGGPAAAPRPVLHTAGRLLVAEDNAVNAKVLVRQLAQFGLHADVHGDGAAALEAWRQGSYAALLTDCHMPIMDGYALARAIREAETTLGRPRLPILALTANAVQDEAERCHAAGMDDVLSKPVTLDELGRTLGRWLSAAGPASAHGGAGQEAADRDGPGPPLDLALLDRQVGGDAAFRREILDDFRAAVAAALDDIAAAAEAGAWDVVRQRAHRLKGTAGALGARRLSEACRAIETAAPAAAAAAVAPLVDRLRAEHAAIEAWFSSPDCGATP